MESFRFKCIACGKCCNSTPMLALSEIPALTGKFIMKLDVLVAYLKNTDSSDSAFGRQYAQFAKLGGMPFSDAYGKGIIRAVGHPVMPQFGGMCTMLQPDGLCAIYDQRPNMCRTVPFDTILAENNQSVSIGRVLHQVAKGSYPCRVDDDAPVIYANGQFVDPDYKSSFGAGVAINTDGEMQVKLLTPIYSNYNAREALMGLISRGIPGILHFSRFIDTFPEFFQDRDRVAEEQLNLIQNAIDENIRRKSPSDKPVTNSLRDLQKTWLEYRRRILA